MTLSIKGVIDADGTIRGGQGFRCQKAGRGFYAIEFDVPFDQAPIAVCTLQGSGEDVADHSVSIINIATSARQFGSLSSVPRYLADGESDQAV